MYTCISLHLTLLTSHAAAYRLKGPLRPTMLHPHSVCCPVKRDKLFSRYCYVILVSQTSFSQFNPCPLWPLSVRFRLLPPFTFKCSHSPVVSSLPFLEDVALRYFCPSLWSFYSLYSRGQPPPLCDCSGILHYSVLCFASLVVNC